MGKKRKGTPRGGTREHSKEIPTSGMLSIIVSIQVFNKLH